MVLLWLFYEHRGKHPVDGNLTADVVCVGRSVQLGYAYETKRLNTKLVSSLSAER